MFEVVGTKGVIRMDPAYEMAQPLRAELTVGDRTVRSTIAKRDQFAAELSYFSDCILNNAAPVPSGLEGLADVRIIRALQDSARSNRPVSIRPVPISRRPSPAQEIARPAVNKPPRLVRAAAPAA
jgi:glucose-fructose oxidoreductase